MVSSSVELVKVAIKAETLTTVGTGYWVHTERILFADADTS